MTDNRKLEALFTAAEAYMDRGFWVQYDQLSMDRLIRITPRRRFTLPPEAATSQQRLYLDCATYVCAAFYNAFGYQLEANVTWYRTAFFATISQARKRRKRSKP